MQRSCPTTECCRANQIRFRCDVKPPNICRMQLNVNIKSNMEERYERAMEAAVTRLGYSGLRDNQRKVVLRFLEGNDVFVSLPTGSGKSLCYWILPFVFDYLSEVDTSIVIVVSPLVSLVEDQVASLCKRGVKAIHINALEEDATVLIHQGHYQLLFFSPESLLTSLEWRNMLCSHVYKERLVGFIVDEAHCVKQW